jgi:putative transposase
VHWYWAYPISYRQVEEMMEERGVEFDHPCLNCWVLKYAPLLGQSSQARNSRVGGSRRMDEPHARIRGKSKYPYRAVENTVDFLLTAKRDRKCSRALPAQYGSPAWCAGEDYYQRECRQHLGHRELQPRAGRRD